MFQHVHLEHELLERLSQLDYESIDETILLPTEDWPLNDDEVINFADEAQVGVDEVEVAPRRFRSSRASWREQPEYQEFLQRYPDLRAHARAGIDSIFAYFGLTPSEADVWALDAAGYTDEWIASQLPPLKPGGVEALLASVQSKIWSKLLRLDRDAALEALRIPNVIVAV